MEKNSTKKRLCIIYLMFKLSINIIQNIISQRLKKYKKYNNFGSIKLFTFFRFNIGNKNLHFCVINKEFLIFLTKN